MPPASAKPRGTPAPNVQQPHRAAAGAPAAPSLKRKRNQGSSRGTPESALRHDADGELTLGGKCPPAPKPAEAWRDRTGLCASNFSAFPRDDDGVWLCVV